MSVVDRANPLWMVYQEFWKLLRDSTQFTTLAKTQIDYFDETKEFPQRKDTLANSDYPVVKIVHSQCPIQLDASSCSALGNMKWQIQVATAQQSAKEELDLAWCIVIAMSRWKARLTALRWNDKQFVGKCGFVESNELLNDSRGNQGIRGWSAVWTGQAQLYFTTADLQA